MRYKISYQLTSIILLIVLSFSCAKEVLVDDLTFQKQLIGGIGSYQNTQKIWRLDSCAFNGKNYPLTAVQKKYTITYNFDGTFKDSDGYSGNWNVPKLDELVYFTNPVDTTLRITYNYKIVEINSAQFNIKLTKKVNKGVVYSPTSDEYFFKIAN